MRNVRSLSLLSLAVLGAACSGNGSSAPRAPLPNATAPGPASATRATATLTLKIPARSTGARAGRARSRHPYYISPSSLGAVLTATSTSNQPGNNALYGYDLSTSGVCTGGGGSAITCTLSFPLDADTYSVKVAVYDQNENGSQASPAGNELSVDTETETVVLGGNNQFTNFLLHGVVKGFYGSPPAFGATGGTPFPSPKPTGAVVAIDADGNNVDGYGNATTYANGPFAPSVTQSGDTTGCATPCVSAANDNGNTLAGSATIDQASDLLFSFSYTGGGGPGLGVKSSTNGSAPSGQQPYSGSIVLTGPNSTASATLVPLFAYPTSLPITNGAVAYVWAAQAETPAGASPSSYSAYFGTPGTSSCTNGSSQTVATLGAGTYYAGYGEVYPVTGGVNGTCTLTLSDGATHEDTVSVPVTVGTPSGGLSVPCNQGPLPPTGSSVVRKRQAVVADAGAAPALVQYALGAQQAILPNPVTAGNTLVVILADVPGSGFPSSTAYTGTFNEFSGAEDEDSFVYTSDIPSTQNIGPILSNDDINGCAAAIWVGEFSGTASSAIQAANASAALAPGNATTPSIVPNAANGLLITSYMTTDTEAAMASTGYTEYFTESAIQGVGAPPYSTLDVQLASTPTTDTTDPVSNTFGGVQNSSGDTDIFQIPPASFTSKALPAARSRSARAEAKHRLLRERFPALRQ